ncbi:diguanylate cyclase (GGDEF)-like protein [Pseudomonas duriflava]|uniref:diguanylate cyclase n=1 Tax=Pseudomonas duriflava TaxID=459528 RepID=A0A562QPQ7_9PSED|nr:sensor domain-containing diguanylate cyclase [Pseudomonas duriflava]TWI58707.1 diguanylate cyclase (GGDEF)-like protein [Pseudomonas duriflava]
MTLVTYFRSQSYVLLILIALLGTGFMMNSWISYQTSVSSIRHHISDTELPLTADNVYSEIQKDLIRPILISSVMSRDTFLRDWVMHGEQDVEQIQRYLHEIITQYGTETAFFVSDKTQTYYQAQGVIKKVSPMEPRDAWFYRVRGMGAPYEINVDLDMANQDQLTIFINYKVFDYNNRLIGVTGVGLTKDAVVKLINDYQQRYGRRVFFVDHQGKIALMGDHFPDDAKRGTPLTEIPSLEGLSKQLPQPKAGSYTYTQGKTQHFLTVRYIPELEWFLFVDKAEGQALNATRHILYWHLFVALMVTTAVLILVSLVLRRFQRRIEALAMQDTLTELPNRRGFGLLAEQALHESRRQQSPLSVAVLDIDHFKLLNDTFGHQTGDTVLRGFARMLRENLRQSDLLCRWGGEEFLILLKDTPADKALILAEKLRDKAAKLQFSHDDVSIQITVSIGVAQLRPNENLEQLIGRGDRALYSAKQRGRNRIVLADRSE